MASGVSCFYAASAHWVMGTVMAACVVTGGGGANAQQGGATSVDKLEEIVVTARKRTETLQDVPFSIDAKTERQLRYRGASNLPQLARNVAGLTVVDLGLGQSQLAIRGISAGQVIRDQPGVKEQVGIYLDESAISVALFTPDLDLFDLNRVEILRGPQGTLFGSGSLAGTLRYITNEPEMNETAGIAEGNYSVVEGGGMGWNLKGAVNVPIVEDKVALRAVAYYDRLPGFIDAIQPSTEVDQLGNPIFPVDDDVNDGRRYGGRLALAIEPNENLRITPRVVFQKIDTDGFPRIDAYNILGNPFTTDADLPPVTLGEREQFTQLEEGLEDDFLLFDLKIEYDFEGVTLTSISSYTDREVVITRDATQLTGSITGGSQGLPLDVAKLDAPLVDVTDLQAFTQEIRLASSGDGPLQWVVGGFYQDFTRDYGQTLNVAGFEEATDIPTAGDVVSTDILFFSDFAFDFRQIALFGEASYQFTDALSFTAGLRWFDFEEDRNLVFDGIFTDQTGPDGVDGDVSSDGVNPRFILSYDVSSDLQVNAQVAKGFRLGGINDPLNTPLCSDEDLQTFGNRPTFEDEEIWNYEIGAKASFDGGRGTFNVAGFYSDIDNLQATIDAGSCSSRIVFNVPSARSIGVEAEFAYQPTENFDFAVAASFVDAEIRSTVTSTVDGVTSPVAGIERGNRLPTAPEFQLNAAATYMHPFDNVLTGFITGTFQHVGSSFTQIGDQVDGFGTVDLFDLGGITQDTFTFDPQLPDYQLANLRLGVRTETWELSFFINNVFDERALLSLDRERGTRARVGFLTNQPRTFGLTARTSF
ncbi:outer membrane receptor protein involved in Fe transport [Eilatimonas milleporae]|uniref:Outer membrane receptor protein involved in Fe transport n=2 Tax=Eilatimonas milleporae TaxID=911205 RepID=A0A3M0BWI1_9PROT|nr:outer membrane receptor protein involved in Fe transport [Eilatimonas milleporae]